MKKRNLFYASALLISALVDAAPLERQPGSAPIEEPPSQAGSARKPDESILWGLFHARKHQELKNQIDWLKKRFPGWTPPADLQRALDSVAVQPPKAHAPQKRPARPKPADPCRGIEAQWDRAETLARFGQTENALMHYRRLLQQCAKPGHRVATLEKAGTALDHDSLMRLIETAGAYVPQETLERIEYGALKKHFLNETTLDPAGDSIRFDRFAQLIERYNDDAQAELIGWRFFERQRFDEAQIWFAKAAQWNANNTNAVKGLALSYEQRNELDKAWLLLDKQKPELDEIKARIGKAKAWREIEANSPIAAADYLRQIEAFDGGDFETQEIRAWIADQQQDYLEAARLFGELYRQAPNERYAEAYVRHQARIDRAELESSARRYGGPLLDEYRKHQAQELYFRKQFLAAYDLAPDAFENLGGIDSAYVDTGVYGRWKSGRSGMDRLDFFRLPGATASHVLNGVHQFKLNLSRVSLDSGKPGICTDPVGSLAPSTACLGAYNGPFSPTERLNESLEIDFSYRMDGWFSPYVRLGSTPISGVIDPSITFDVGFVQQTERGYWGLNVYSQPVRQSLLSYTGIKDPYSNQLDTTLPASGDDLTWGRVLRSGVRASGYYQLDEEWGGFASAEVAMLRGERVANNTAFAFSTGFGRNFRLSGFDYFSVGPSLIYEHYENNLSHFTFGHGGYFSPEHYINAGLGVNFLTEEGRSFVIKGRAVVGAQIIEEASAPWFPLIAPGRGSYASNEQVGEALDFELKGVWLVASNLQLGAGAAMRRTNNFEDYTGGLFIRYFFNDRKASYSTDIPDNLFGNMLFY